jgi:hypothetical protein
MWGDRSKASARQQIAKAIHVPLRHRRLGKYHQCSRLTARGVPLVARQAHQLY